MWFVNLANCKIEFNHIRNVIALSHSLLYEVRKWPEGTISTFMTTNGIIGYFTVGYYM